jgi:hypothetical protein
MPDILPVIWLDVREERIHCVNVVAFGGSPELLEFFGAYQHVTSTGRGINDVHGSAAMFLDGLPEIVGKFNGHGIFLGGG